MIGAMLVLIATNETQGDQPGDFAHAVDGELVTPVGAECCSPATCGCGRGFPGLASARATTIAMVVDRPELTEQDLRDAVWESLDRGGWADHLDDDEFDALVDDHLDCIATVCEGFPVGTVVSRWGSKVYPRPSARAA